MIRSMSKWSLKTQLTVSLTVVVLVVSAIIGGCFIESYKADFRSHSLHRENMIRESLRNKGVSITRNVAFLSEGAITVLDFIRLADLITSTVENDDEIIYGIVMDRENQAVVHTSSEKVGVDLTSVEALFAGKQAELVVQTIEVGEKKNLEVVAPMNAAGNRWTLRLGLSLENVNRQIAENRKLVSEQIEERVNRYWSVLAIAFVLVIGVIQIILHRLLAIHREE